MASEELTLEYEGDEGGGARNIKITRDEEIIIGGCGCCGSPFSYDIVTLGAIVALYNLHALNGKVLRNDE